MPRHKAEWFGPRLKSLREAAGLTQAQLGERAGVHGSQINKLELGVNQPTLATALALAKGLGVKIADFVGDREAEVEGDDQGEAPKAKKAASRKAGKTPRGSKKST